MARPALSALVKKVLPLPALEAYYAVKYRRVEILRAVSILKPLRGRRGIEIGGPSPIFREVLPVYRFAASLDCANFADQTTWEGRIVAGPASFRFDGDRAGVQYVLEATALDEIASHQYDFLMSSNCLEHVANPIKALREWMRVVAPGGHILLVLPRKESNFDHRRQTTSFAHLLDDYENDVDEHDMTHLEEILAAHDFGRDRPAKNPEFFRQRAADNFGNRCLHHHVFDDELIARLFEHLGIRRLHAIATDYDYIALGRLP